MNNKRPRNNRNNSRRGGGGGGQGGGRQSHNLESNGPGMKIRGNPNQIFEKYQALARDAHTAGDRVMEENYAQHGEHYYRLANGDGANYQQRQQQQQNQQQQQQPQQQDQQQDQPEAVVSLTETPSVESEGAEGAIVEPVGVEAGDAEKEATPSPRDMAKEPQPVVE